MPRIPVRTTPYHTLPRCTRHYKSKRDLILRALGKASFINGSQFVIAWISPKGEVDSYASELLQSAVHGKDPNAVGVLNRKELDREAQRIKGEMLKRWDQVRRLEESGDAPVLEDDGADDAAVEADNDEEEIEGVNASGEFDPDQTLVDDAEIDIKFLTNDSTTTSVADVPLISVPVAAPVPASVPLTATSSAGPSMIKKPTPANMMSSFPTTATRSSTPCPQLHTITLAPDAVESYYCSRFAALQQATCKLVVKNWIKIIEPKKQMKFPYNKGEDLKPQWWPDGVRHREPDHLSKQERLTLLTAIVRSPLISVSRLELSTAEAGAFISGPRQSILREVYLVAKEEEKKRKEGDTSPDLCVHLPHSPVSPSAVSPEGGEKRSHAQMDATADINKENIYHAGSSTQPMMGMSTQPYGAAQPQKRMKNGAGRLTALNVPQAYDPATYGHPFTFAPQNLNIQPSQPTAWRDGLSAPPPHLSPYPQDVWAASAPPTEYARSPMPELDMAHATSSTPTSMHPPHNQAKYATHLAPILTTGSMNGTPSPLESPAYTSNASAQSTSYFPRSDVGHSYMQQQQLEYLQQHQQPTYDYGSPYIADWDPTYTTA